MELERGDAVVSQAIFSPMQLDTPADHSPGKRDYRPNLHVGIYHDQSLIQKWRAADKVFDGKFAAPASPHTPVTSLESRLKSVQSQSIKDKHREGARKRRFAPIRELLFDDDTPKASPSEALFSPMLSAHSSIIDDSDSRYAMDFEEIALVSAGDFGEVYRCMHKLDRQHYAVKRVKISPGAGLGREESLQEALTLAASSFYCDSKHILKYRNMWLERDWLFIATELCQCSLREMITAEVEEELAVLALRDVAKGLRELHGMKAVHLDVKPENILFSFSHRFKLGDLGLSRLLSHIQEGSEVPEGDARYLAPELLQIVPEDPDSIPDLTKCDVFSLGATIYELMVGTELPLNGDQWRAIRSGELAFPQRWSRPLVSVVTAMLHPDPERRPSAADILSVALTEATVPPKKLDFQ